MILKQNKKIKNSYIFFYFLESAWFLKDRLLHNNDVPELAAVWLFRCHYLIIHKFSFVFRFYALMTGRGFFLPVQNTRTIEEQIVHDIKNTYFATNILIKIDYLGGWDNSIYQFQVFFSRNTKYDVLRSLPFVRYNTCLSPPPPKKK